MPFKISGPSATGGRSPSTLDDPTEADLQVAEQFLEEFAVRLPSAAGRRRIHDELT